MFIYNVTINVDSDIHTNWLTYMKEVHIPDVLATGYFKESKMYRILSEDEGFTYSIQYFFDHMDDYEKYKNKEASRLQKEVMDLYKNRFVAFRTLLEQV